MTYRTCFIASATFAALAGLLLAGPAMAQDRNNGNFLDNLFSRGESKQPEGQSEVEVRRSGQAAQGGQVAQSDPADLTVRIDRIENALRQLTGTLEQLQYRNQQLEMQLKRMQDDTEFRLQQLGSKGNPNPGAIPGGGASPNMAPPARPPGNRSDVFDPSRRPNAPGAPRTLGNGAVIAAPEQTANNEQPIGAQIGAPGGRAAGAPLDLSTPGALASAQPGAMASAGPPTMQPPIQSASPAQPPRNAGGALATLPPTATPQDEYDMAYGYVLHKDYALAEQAFRDFIKKYPGERLVPEANYWLGESLYQRQRYRDAAESFLAVSTKYEKSGKAPDSLLRLGQSLAALNQKEAACATLAEVERKFPKASAAVKRGVTQEQKRAHC
ncbi:MAG: tol-pal system protein YbgF [Pseudolabrys sp.]